jgi:hypothetical protein
MDFRDVLLQNENALPTLADMAPPSTSPVNGVMPGGRMGSLPTVTASSSTVWKIGISTIIGLLGMYYLAAGKKQNDVGKMILGAGLTLASLFLF